MKKLLHSLIIALLLIAGSAQASSSFTCNGNTYTWPDQFVNYQYVTNWPLMMTDCLTQFATYAANAATSATAAANSAITATTSAATQGTSTTSLTIGTGSQTPFIQTGKGFLTGMTVRIADQAAPTANYMDGIVSAYNSGTGALSVTITSIGGSGTKSAWNVFMQGPLPFPTIANGHLLGNGTGGSTAAQDTTLTSLIDQAFGSAQGNIIYRGSSSWEVLTPGTAGQALLTNGVAANPSYGTLSRTQLGSQSGSSLSTITFSNVIGSSINDVKLNCHGLVPSTSLTFYVQVGTGATPTWITSGYVYGSVTGSSTSVTGSLNTSTSGFQVNNEGAINQTSPTGLIFSMEIMNLQNSQTSNIDALSQTGGVYISGGNMINETASGYVASGSAAITSIRIIPSTGTFSGACALYANSGA